MTPEQFVEKMINKYYMSPLAVKDIIAETAKYIQSRKQYEVIRFKCDMLIKACEVER